MTNDTDTMPITDYLAQGGKLTSPENVPPRYRGELLRLMSSFVDSELGGFGRLCRGDQLGAGDQGAHRRQPDHAGKGRPRRNACST